MPLTPDELAHMQMDDDGAPPRRERTAFLQVYRESWTASITRGGNWTELRPATRKEREVAAISKANGDKGAFWLASIGAPYHALGARRCSDQLARVVHEYS